MNWNPKQTRYIQWLAQPNGKRSPASEAELALELNRRLATLQRWRTLPGFQDAVTQAINDHLHQRLPAIYESIGQQAEGGDFRFVKLALELMAYYPVPKNSDIKETERSKPTISIEEYKEIVQKINKWKKELYEKGAGK
jgi:hypothetical protein